MSKYRNEQRSLTKKVGGLPLERETYIKNIYPSYLGIMLIGKIFGPVFDKLKTQIELVFKSFYFDITLIRELNLNNHLNRFTTKEEFNLFDRSLTKVILYPTNVFYSIIKNRMLERNLAFGLGLTNLPIYSSSDEKLLFLFGEANLKHNSAIVSTHNLRNFTEHKNVEDRIIKEAIHEIGHLILGPQHCMNDNCVMQFSANTEGIDKKLNRLCEKCKLKLENIRVVYNF